MIYRKRQDANILIAGDDGGIARTMLELFARKGVHADLANDYSNAADFLDKSRYDLVFAADNLRIRSDLPAKRGACFELLGRIRTHRPELPVVLIQSACGGQADPQCLADSAVMAVRAGFCELLTLPLCREKIEAILEIYLPDHPVQAGASAVENGREIFAIVGKSVKLSGAISLARRIAPDLGACSDKRRERNRKRTNIISDSSGKQEGRWSLYSRQLFCSERIAS